MIGRTIAQYDIVAKLGGGGMGVVYLARDTKLGRAVALKFLPPRWMHDEAAKQRFLREAQAASATNHRNICIIHDIEETDDGQLFIVMAHYEGQTLKQKLESGPLPIAEALEVATEIAEGLAKAHAQGVVHRDIKPGNLMITDDGVKILDFGLAKLADAALKLTMEGSTLGTVAYMAPEQARGEEADERSDIWALGVVLYEMLTGQCPFKGTYPEAIFYAIKNEPPVPIAGTGKDIPEDVERVVMPALAKDPAERYQNAREFARELRFLQGRSVPLDLRTAPLPPIEGRGKRDEGRKSRRLTRKLLIAAGAVFAISTSATYLWLARPIPRIPIAIVPIANHTGEKELDAYRLALTQSLISELADSPNLRVTSYQRVLEILRRYMAGKGDVSSREAIQQLAQRAGAELLIVPSLTYRDGSWMATAELRNVQTGTNISAVHADPIPSSLYKETAHRLMAALAARIQEQFKLRWPRRVPGPRSVGGRFRSLEAARAFEEGINAHEQMEHATALAAFKRAIEHDPQRSIGYAWLSRTALLMGDIKAAEAAARSASQLVTTETPRSDALFVAAALAESQNDQTAADKRYRDLAASYADDPAAQIEFADFLKRRSQNELAVDTYHSVLALDADYTRAHVDLCQVYVRLDDYPLADKHARAALSTYRDRSNPGGEAQALLCLGDLQRAQGGAHLVDAQKNIEAARNIFASLKYPYGLSRVYQYLGTSAGNSGNYPTAAKYFEEALSRSRQVGNRQLEALQLMNLGVTYNAIGQRSDALKYYQQAHDFYQQVGDERRAAEQEINAASVLINAGSEWSAALRRLENAQATLRKLGAVDFDVFAMQLKGVNSVYTGDPIAGTRELRAALNLAKERQLTNRIVSISARLAEAAFLMGDYKSARTVLDDIMTTDAGREDIESQILLGRVHSRLGDFNSARAYLDRALSLIKSTGQTRLAPGAYLGLGEVAYGSGDIAAARGHFERGAGFWTDNLPDAASVEARCYQGMLEGLRGRLAVGRSLLQSGIDQARMMGRVYLEKQCRANLSGLTPSLTRGGA